MWTAKLVAPLSTLSLQWPLVPVHMYPLIHCSYCLYETKNTLTSLLLCFEVGTKGTHGVRSPPILRAVRGRDNPYSGAPWA